MAQSREVPPQNTGENPEKSLGKILKEAGVSVYAQTPGAEKIYRETRAPGMGGEEEQSRASASQGQRVVDAEYKETDR